MSGGDHGVSSEDRQRTATDAISTEEVKRDQDHMTNCKVQPRLLAHGCALILATIAQHMLS